MVWLLSQSLALFQKDLFIVSVLSSILQRPLYCLCHLFFATRLRYCLCSLLYAITTSLLSLISALSPKVLFTLSSALCQKDLFIFSILCFMPKRPLYYLCPLLHTKMTFLNATVLCSKQKLPLYCFSPLYYLCLLLSNCTLQILWFNSFLLFATARPEHNIAVEAIMRHFINYFSRWHKVRRTLLSTSVCFCAGLDDDRDVENKLQAMHREHHILIIRLHFHPHPSPSCKHYLSYLSLTIHRERHFFLNGI